MTGATSPGVFNLSLIAGAAATGNPKMLTYGEKPVIDEVNEVKSH